MSFNVSKPPSFLQKYWRFVLAGLIVIIFFILIFVGLNYARHRADDFETLSQASNIRDGLALYFYDRNDYPPAGAVQNNIEFGLGGALCLDLSDDGIKNTCDKNIIIGQLPQRYFYKKSAVGDYALNFNLQGKIDGLRDVNGDGKIGCIMNKDGIECK